MAHLFYIVFLFAITLSTCEMAEQSKKQTELIEKLTTTPTPTPTPMVMPSAFQK